MIDFIENMDAGVLILICALLPLIQAVINRYQWEASTKALVSFVVAVGVGVGAGFAMGITSREGLISSAAATYLISQGAYFGVLRPTGLAEAIERKVLPGEPRGGATST